ncbi:TIGR02597 family protein [Rubellicoccus peritrichatus]|uniref:TIGR02597 family protein n=1 Tax=Rubellicoccus peritrichatus TaxID=3080537 RepID=A0AAQ3LCZ6_9BACT|nr:TIGR02597 family protein [Puniceicoccus sp. CR14]WOO43521.1 TIGR02597 family protein [Puniceicoccus sp. CR14]
MKALINRFSRTSLLILTTLSLGVILPNALFASGSVCFSQGYVEVDVLAGSDTLVSIPFHRSVEHVGTLAAVPAQSNGEAVLSAAGDDPEWETDAYNDLYFVRFIDGSLQGLCFTVVSNDSSVLTVDDLGADFSGLTAGVKFELIPYWTLETLFPPAEDNGLTPSTGKLTFQRKTQLLYPNLAGTGINLSVSAVYFFTTNDGWLEDTSGFPDASNVIIYPDTYIIIRQPSSVADTSISLSGSVDMHPLTTSLATEVGTKQDNFVSLNRPIPVTLAQSGLASGFVESTGKLSFQRKDELLVFDNTTAATNRSASKIFFMTGGSWFEDTSGFPNADSFLIQPGSAMIVRKAANDGDTDFAVTTAPY